MSDRGVAASRRQKSRPSRLGGSARDFFFGPPVRPIHLVGTGIPVYLPEILRNNFEKGPYFRWEVLAIWITSIDRIFSGQKFAQKRDEGSGFEFLCQQERWCQNQALA
jgi:hypothetical protein